MYKLLVSYDVGIHYRQHMESEDLEVLRTEGAKLDEQTLRWVIEDEQDEIIDASRIHKQILAFMDRISRT